MPPHSLTNFEIQSYYQNEPRFNGVYSRKNLTKKNKGWGIRNKPSWIGTHWIALFCKKNEIIYFDNSGVEHVSKEMKEFVGNKNIKANIFWAQANNSVMCGYFCIGFIDLCQQVKNWLIILVCFLLMIQEKRWYNFDLFQRWMNVIPFDKTNLTELTKFGVDKTTEIENFFIEEINQRTSCSKKKQICSWFWLHRQDFNWFKCNNQRSIYLFVYELCWSSCRNSKCKFSFNFFSNNRNCQKITKYNKKKKKKHDKILMLAKSKLNSIETFISEALINVEISHEEFIAIFKEKDKYEKMKENLRSENEKKKLWDWVVWNQRLKTKIKWKTVKNYWAFTPSKKKKNLCVHVQNGSNQQRRIEEIWSRDYWQ